MKPKTQKITLIVTFVLLFVGLFAISGNAAGEKQEEASRPQALELPTVGTLENLQELLKDFYRESISLYYHYSMEGGALLMDAVVEEMAEAEVSGGAFNNSLKQEAVAEPAAPAPTEAPAPTGTDEAGGGGGGEYSETNVQVAGVDEADRVKTDGKYIYKISRDKLQIVQAVPASQMKILSELTYNTEEFSPQEIYIDDSRVVLLGRYYDNTSERYPNWCGQYWRSGGMRVLIYDMSVIEQPRLMRQTDFPGEKISTRKVGDYLYFAVTQTIDSESLQSGENYLPVYQEQTFGKMGESNQTREIPLDEVYYFPEALHPQYLLMGAIQIQDLAHSASVYACLADGSALYASRENMYVALTDWQVKKAEENSVSDTTDSARLMAVEPEPIEVVWTAAEEPVTRIYRFGLDEMDIYCNGMGEVPGEILNQFSMDESGGYFRIATTTGDMWAQGDNISKNNLYVLDANLEKVGEVTGIAPGEQIYSVRFMGDRAYMVTFRTVDPFFVLDLSDPTAPTVLGQLKIPGYSDYLHPYDANHVIGFGKDTIEIDHGGGEPTAYYLGLKVSLFDVTDVTNPIEKDKIIIGDRGTYSEILEDHKALLFDYNRNLLAFPVTVMSLNGRPVVEKDYGYEYPNYGDFSYQGAFVYHVDENGFSALTQITHISDDMYKKAGGYRYESSYDVRRILYIGDQLYTISDQLVKAHAMSSWNETGNLALMSETE